MQIFRAKYQARWQAEKFKCNFKQNGANRRVKKALQQRARAAHRGAGAPEKQKIKV